MGQFNTRIQHKHDTEANWIRASRATNPFIPLLGEIIFYDADDNYHYTRMKIGDGEKTVDALPFIDAHTFDENGIIKQNVLPEGYPYAASGEVLPMTSVSIDPDEGMGMIVDKFSLVKDVEYEVIWNGASYTCIAKETASGTIPMIALGNLESVGGDYADAPFIIANLDDETALQAGYYGGVIVLDNSTEVNLSINRATLQKMDNKYLDLEWLPTMVDGYSDGELLGEIDRSTQNNGDIDGLTFDNILKGQTYIVYYNGTRYTQVARETLYNELPIRYLGNLSISNLDGAINTGEPFVVTLAKMSETTIWTNANDITGSTSFVLSVYTAVPAPEYNKMPEEFLPSSVVSKSDLDGLATETYVNNIASTKVDKVDGKGLSTNDYTTTEKNKLSGIASGAEVNQNAFSNVVVGSTTIAADSKTDSLTIAAGTGISVAGDATNDKVTITNSGVRAISTGSSNGTISVNTNGTAVDVAIKGLGSAAYTASTAYDAAGTAQTKADAALKSAKTYADGIKNDLLNGAGSAYDTLKELGELIDTNVDAIDALETVAASKADKTHTHAIADVSDLQSSLDAKVPTSRTINGKALTTDISLTASDVGALPDSTVIPSIDGLATEAYVNTQVSTKPGKFGTGSKAEIFNVDINKATGNYSHAEGYATTASGEGSHAEGQYTTAFGSDSHAEGSSYSNIIDLTGEANTTEYVYSNTKEYKNNDYFVVNGSIVFVTNVDATNKIITVSNTLSAEAITNKRYTILRGIAIGNNSHTEGYGTTASGNYSHAEGNRTTASGRGSHAEGSMTTASSDYSHTEGYGTTASGDYSHAEGNRTTASGDYSHAEGNTTTASGDYSHAEGNRTTASGEGSHAEGYLTTASGNYQHVQGKCNIKDTADSYAHIVGNGTLSKYSNAHTLDWDGNAWFAGDVYVGSTSGRNKDAGSKKLVTEADLASLTASDVGALPDTTVIPSIDGLATEEYVNTQVSSLNIPSIEGLATEEYVNTQVSTKPGKFSNASNAEIFNDLTSNKASNRYSHAEGSMTTASGYTSHAEGENTTASGRCSHAEGEDTTASGQDSHAEGMSTIASGIGAHAEGTVSAFSINLTGEANATEYVCSGHHQSYCKVDSYFKVNGSIIFITNVSKNNNITTITVSNTLSAEAITDKEYTVYRGIAKGHNSHTEGLNTTTSSGCAHAEGNITTASGYASHAEGDSTTATGQSSHAEGNYTTASGNYSHAEGNQTTASGDYSHAEGSYTTASGTRSHAEGWGADASGDQSHAEGNYTVASGRCSHAEGGYTEAYGDYQHVQGKHNLTRTLEAANNYAHIVGGGTASNDRKDIHTLDWDGNAWFAGDVYVGSTSGKDKDEGSKKLVTEADLASLAAQITEAVSQKSQIQLITWEADD